MLKRELKPGMSSEKSRKSGKRPVKVLSQEDWTVDEFTKDVDYFHSVVGLPNVGRIPKDLTADDISPEVLEEYFGVKSGKNGYKKDGVKGIPVDYIAMLTCAVDGIGKFQQYSTEVARGLYYERILGKPVNWAACAADKHRGQLRLRFVRSTPIDRNSPPWKRIETRYITPVEPFNVVSPPQNVEFESSNPKPVDPEVEARGDNQEEPGEPLSELVGEPGGDLSPQFNSLKAVSKISTGTAVPNQSRELLESMLEIVEASLAELGPKRDKAIEDAIQSAAKQDEASVTTKAIEKLLSKLKVLKDEHTATIHDLQHAIQAQATEQAQISEDLQLLQEPDEEHSEDEAICEDLRGKFLECCNKTNLLQNSLASEKQKRAELISLAQAKMNELNALDDDDIMRKQSLHKLEQAAKTLRESYDALSVECSRLQEHLSASDAVYVCPVSILCPAQTEETFFSITECPVCSLGFFFSNWIPTPCGHCYHPSCLFPLLRNGESKAPKCLACAELFHPSWLECWGSSQVDHPDIVKLADDLGLREQSISFWNNISDMYCNNALSIKARREKQAIKHKKVTMFYSKESVKKTTDYHEAVGKAMHVHNELLRNSADHKKSSTSTNIRQQTSVQNSKGELNDPSIDLSTVKVEKGAKSLEPGSVTQTPGNSPCVVEVSGDFEPGSKTGKGLCSKKRKAGETGTASSAVTAQESMQGDGAVSPGVGLNADSEMGDCVGVKSVSNVKPGRVRGRGRGTRVGTRQQKYCVRGIALIPKVLQV